MSRSTPSQHFQTPPPPLTPFPPRCTGPPPPSEVVMLVGAAVLLPDACPEVMINPSFVSTVAAFTSLACTP